MPNSPEQQYPHLSSLLNQQEPLNAEQLTDLREGFEDGLDSATMSRSAKTGIGAEVRKHFCMLKLIPPGTENHLQIHTYWSLINEFRQRVDGALEIRRDMGHIPYAGIDSDAWAF